MGEKSESTVYSNKVLFIVYKGEWKGRCFEISIERIRLVVGEREVLVKVRWGAEGVAMTIHLPSFGCPRSK